MADIHDDDLTEFDLKFLEKFNKLGRSDTADSEYGSDVEIQDAEAEGEGDGRPDPDVIEGLGDEQGESEEVDETKMDVSDLEGGEIETETESSDEAEEKDHLETGESDSEIQDGESDLDYDDEDNYQLDQEAEDNRHESDDLDNDDDLDDESGDPDMGFDEGGEETHYDQGQVEDDGDLHTTEADDDYIEGQVEEDEGEGERGNSDEARESDEPIGQEEAKADADKEMEGDAQQELEDHLRNEQPDSEDKSEGDDPSDEHEEQEPHGGNGSGEAKFSDMPGQGENCSDHCEDNEADSEHECPRCAERIMRERKMWGAVATDMNGDDLLPGDKIRVEIPMSFFSANAILTVNVPNVEMDRIASKTNGEQDDSALWLSGKNISQFTGWNFNRMPVWTFTQGRVLRFAVKVGEPIREGGGQGDIEDQVEELKEDLDDLDFNELLNQDEEEQDEEPEEKQDEEDEDYNGKLTSTQIKRFKNLFDRLEKKVEQTFGNTAETVKRGDIVVTGEIVARPITVLSRGVEYGVVLTASRSDA